MSLINERTSARNKISDDSTPRLVGCLAIADQQAGVAQFRADGRQCSALGITATGNAPVLTLCRRLIEAGHNPILPLEAYRGTTLCLRVLIECKAPGRKLSAAQVECHEALTRAGAIIATIDNIDDALAFLRRLGVMR
jgi:hypothetical protein